MSGFGRIGRTRRRRRSLANQDAWPDNVRIHAGVTFLQSRLQPSLTRVERRIGVGLTVRARYASRAIHGAADMPSRTYRVTLGARCCGAAIRAESQLPETGFQQPLEALGFLKPET